MTDRRKETRKTRERRENGYRRTHYDQVKACYECNGYNNCPQYIGIATYDELPYCGWRETVDHDLEKIKKGKKHLTFPVLELIIERDMEERGLKKKYEPQPIVKEVEYPTISKYFKPLIECIVKYLK